ncbi:hypothetical protein Pd630_LPD03227 [Rhodococcus opacus PD630]|nr:hypothetical protein Pd630_LPD03227 [Rhodococcus opacus PD630]
MVAAEVTPEAEPVESLLGAYFIVLGCPKCESKRPLDDRLG